MSWTTRSLGALVVAMAISATAGGAHAQNLTMNDCTTFDESRLEEAAAFVFDHLDVGLTIIATDLVLGSPYGYYAIGEEMYGEWAEEFEDLYVGDIDIECHYGSEDDCGECISTGDGDCGYMMGRTIRNCPDNNTIHLCMDNIKDSLRHDAATNADKFIAEYVSALAGHLTHETIHHVDGDLSHGASGKATTFDDPDSPAETIEMVYGTLALTPELEPYRRAMAAEPYSSHRVWFDFEMGFLENNDNFVGGASTKYCSGDQSLCYMGGWHTICTYVDGAYYGQQTGGQSDPAVVDEQSFNFILDDYDPAYPTHTFEFFADCDDEYWEADEDNNLAAVTVDMNTDLSIQVELAHRPYLIGTASGDYYRLYYDVTVTNNDTDRYAPNEVDLSWWYWDDQGGIFRFEEQLLHALAPGESFTTTYEIDAPADSTGTTVTGWTPTLWVIDYGQDSAHDSDRSNNAAFINISASYWRPDLRVDSVACVLGSCDVTVVNMGPVEVSQPFWVNAEDSSSVVQDRAQLFGLTINPLETTEVSSPVTLTGLFAPPCDSEEFTINVNPTGAITENDANNNSAEVTLVNHIGPDCTAPWEWANPLGGFEDHGKWVEWSMMEGYLQLLQDTQDLPMSAKDLWLYGGSNGPFLPLAELLDAGVRYDYQFDRSGEVWAVTAVPHTTPMYSYQGRADMVDTVTEMMGLESSAWFQATTTNF